MINSKIKTKALLKKLPKVLLHTHLEGSIPEKTLSRISKRNNIELPFPVKRNQIKKLVCQGKWDYFFKTYFIIAKCFVNKNDFSEAIYDYATELNKENVRHVEIHCTPWIHISRGLKTNDIASGLYEGIQKAKADCNISVKIIFDLIRSADEKVSEITKWMIELPRKHFTAIGISGGPNSIPYNNYIRYCDKLRKSGYKVVAHAGELEGADSISSVINELNVDRVCHGIRAFEDQQLLSRIIKEKIHLEFCPSSNDCLGISNYKNKYINSFLKAGGNCSINTDDEFFFDTSIIKEYNLLIDILNLNSRDIQFLINNSIKSSFMSNKSKVKLLKEAEKIILYHNQKIQRTQKTAPLGVIRVK